MKKLLLFGLLMLAGGLLQVLDYGLATALKGPIYVTSLSGRRFIRFQGENVSRIAFEDANGELRRVNDDLNGIDMASFQPLHSAETAAGVGRVDTRYRDKNYQYTIHDGEEKYVVRRPSTM